MKNRVEQGLPNPSLLSGAVTPLLSSLALPILLEEAESLCEHAWTWIHPSNPDSFTLLGNNTRNVIHNSLLIVPHNECILILNWQGGREKKDFHYMKK